MKKYKVTFTKYETYYVEANDPYEAEDMAFDLLDNDKLAFLLDPVDEIRVEKCNNG